jgi:hypothetical protein
VDSGWAALGGALIGGTGSAVVGIYAIRAENRRASRADDLRREEWQEQRRVSYAPERIRSYRVFMRALRDVDRLHGPVASTFGAWSSGHVERSELDARISELNAANDRLADALLEIDAVASEATHGAAVALREAQDESRNRLLDVFQTGGQPLGPALDAWEASSRLMSDRADSFRRAVQGDLGID